MLKKVLIANRGEIALRIIRTAHRIGVKTVAVYSDADRDASYLKLADESVRIGGPTPAESYLNVEALIRVARKTGVEGLHPGYGFLSENAEFAKACSEAGLTFVGPDARTLETTGNKVRCKKLAIEAGVPVIPSTVDPIATPEDAVEAAEKFGYPVLLKSAYGGGGRGIREVRNSAEAREGFERAASEARGAFGRAEIYVEKLVRPARHIEVQIVADGKGHVLQLGERECSIQRRHQKLIEMTPSPAVTPEMREKLGEYAIRVARAVHYSNCGTVEFLLDEAGRFHFMEVNSRLQVEHPITEAVTGLDLVAEQLSIASGDGLSLSQEEVRMTGASLECRVNAEDPVQGFVPDVGTIRRLILPGGPGVRIDSAIHEGYVVSEFYDSLLAKLVTWGKDFAEVRKRMALALSEFSLTGVKTTLPLYRLIMDEPRFTAGKLSTDYLEESGVLRTLAQNEAAQLARRQKVAAAVSGAILALGLHRIVDLSGPGGESERVLRRRRYYDAL